ncbi:MAG: hypothetical protein K8S55_03130 [Phycisphaerae bacterium]|nr:hypothetical protein [Phycisphaerae bacterium]
MIRPHARRMLLAKVVEFSAMAAIAAEIVCAVVICLAATALPETNLTALPWLFLLAGGLAGAATALLRGVTTSQAAKFLDRRFHLAEQLATAVELAESGDETPAAIAVYSQATAAVKTKLPARPDVWTRTKKTPAAGLLALLICVVLAWLAGGRSQTAGDADRMIGSLDAMSQARRAAVAEAFRRASRKANNTAAAENLTELARVIEVPDEAKLRRLIQALKQAGVNLREVLPPDVQRDLQLSHTRQSQAGKTADIGKGQDTTGKLQPSDDTGLAVNVYNPLYAAEIQSHGGKNLHPTTPAAVSFDDAWTAAQTHAAAALKGENVPTEYRPIVRAFFRDETTP